MFWNCPTVKRPQKRPEKAGEIISPNHLGNVSLTFLKYWKRCQERERSSDVRLDLVKCLSKVLDQQNNSLY